MMDLRRNPRESKIRILMAIKAGMNIVTKFRPGDTDEQVMGYVKEVVGEDEQLVLLSLMLFNDIMSKQKAGANG